LWDEYGWAIVAQGEQEQGLGIRMKVPWGEMIGHG
jgi:hypothetical protein